MADFDVSLHIDDFMKSSDIPSARDALLLGTLATQNGTFSGTSSGTNTGDQTDISGNAATVTTNANLSGVVTSIGNQTDIADAALSIAKTNGLRAELDAIPSSSQTLTNKTLGTGTVITSSTMTLGSDGTGDIYYRASNGVLTRLPVGSPGHVLTSSGGLPTWAVGGLSNFTESLNIAAPNATVPVTQLLAANAATNVDFSATPKGTGALLAQIPDNTTTGGNKRGASSVDWQRVRAVNTQVASGTGSVISGGYNNTSSGNRTTVAGGDTNQAIGSFSTVGGGSTNIALTVGSTVGGGLSNTAGSGITEYPTVGGGRSNSATGDYSSITGGRTNTASSSYSSVFGGQGNTASGAHSSVAGGENNTASGAHSQASGYFATTRGIAGVKAHASGQFAVLGDAQEEEFILRTTTTNGTTTELGTTGGLGASTRIVLPNNHAYKFRGQAIARQATTGDVKSWDITGTIKRGANAASTAIVGAVTVTVKDEDAGANVWTLAIDADTTNGSLRVQGTGEAAKTIRWLVEITTLEIG